MKYGIHIRYNLDGPDDEGARKERELNNTRLTCKDGADYVSSHEVHFVFEASSREDARNKFAQWFSKALNDTRVKP